MKRLVFTGLLPIPVRLAATNITLTIVTFTTGIMLARALGPEGRGVYGAIALWALTAANISAWGGQITLAREVARRPQRAAAVYSTAYRMAIAGGSIGIIGYLALIPPLTTIGNAYPLWLVVVSSLIIPFSILNAFLLHIELGRGRFRSFNVIRALFACINLMVVAALWLAGATSVVSFLIALIATTLLSTAIAAILTRRSLGGPTAAEKPSCVRQSFIRSTPAAIVLLVAGVAQQADKLLASAIFEPRVLGVYIVAAAVAQIQTTVGEALSQMYFLKGAQSADLASVDKDWLSLRLRQTVFVYLILCIGALSIVPSLVPLIYGAEFRPAADLLYILLPGAALQGMNRPFEEFLRGLDQPAVPLRMAAAVIACVAIFGLCGHVFQSPYVLATGVVSGFGLSLCVASTSLARQLNTSALKFVIPRPADVIALWESLSTSFKPPAAAQESAKIAER